MLRKILARRNLAPNVVSEHRTKVRHEAFSHPPLVETPVPFPIPSNPCSNIQIALGRKLSFEFLDEKGLQKVINLEICHLKPYMT